MTDKKLLRYIFLVCFSFFFIGQANVLAQDFEGTIYYEIPEMKKQGMGEMPYMIKDKNVRMEFGEGDQKGAMLFLPEESRMVVIIDAMKGFMSMNLDDVNNMNNQSGEDQMADMSRTGEIKTIAGRSCEVWKITSEGETFEACIAKGLGNFMMPENPMGNNNSPAWAEELKNGGFMPLEVLEVKGDQRTTQMKATKIEEGTLDASLFEVPPGYNDMSSMMKQMRNGN